MTHLGDDDYRGMEVGRRFVDAATTTPTTMGRQRLASMAALLPQQHSAARDLTEDIRAALAA
ncbi:hypothetical protein [Streptomyces lincolnensis]|uniref:hypothetical protein n=1 Tax=Streptomyces lincolnensis TaxID=1915 RepID=UPI00082A0FEA|nr:hypothetical protein [Streptomyces lincolnensis]QMV07887.1 hypothetical protein GJU35_20920 [Streptomyces lincolnensis]